MQRARGVVHPAWITALGGYRTALVMQTWTTYTWGATAYAIGPTGSGVNTSTSEFTPLRGWVLQYLFNRACLHTAFDAGGSALATRTRWRHPSGARSTWELAVGSGVNIAFTKSRPLRGWARRIRPTTMHCTRRVEYVGAG